MKNFFEKNKIFLAIIVGALIIGGAIYISFGQKEGKIEDKTEIEKQCSNIPELADGAIKLATKIIDGDTFLIGINGV